MTETTLIEQAYVTSERKRKTYHNQLNAKILSAVDDSLTSFGESVRQVVYFQLHTKYQMEKNEIPSRIEEFAQAIEEIFGIGARLIEMRIMETLCSQANGFLYVPKNEHLTFKDYVHSVRRYLAHSPVA